MWEIQSLCVKTWSSWHTRERYTNCPLSGDPFALQHQWISPPWEIADDWAHDIQLQNMLDSSPVPIVLLADTQIKNNPMMLCYQKWKSALYGPLFPLRRWMVNRLKFMPARTKPNSTMAWSVPTGEKRSYIDWLGKNNNHCYLAL